MSQYQLAQLNVGVIKGPLDSPVMAEFVANLARINALADCAPGFVWRLQTDQGDATGAPNPLGADVIVNLSVWDDVATLSDYVYKSLHVEIMRRRKEWFERMPQAFQVLWWVPRGERPSVEQACARLEHLRAHGSTAQGFGFRDAWPAPDAPPTGVAEALDANVCPAA